ncbi:MAG: hypothetical protein ABIP94_11305 [Planctomycetota bacterium]
MSLPNRRSFLGYLGAGAVAGRATSPVAQLTCKPVTPPNELDALVELVRKTPRRELLAKVIELRADWRDLLAAAFLAGIRDVEPRPVGFQFHCVMMTSSAFEIAARAPENERLAAALYNLDDFKQSQAQDAQRGDWSMATAPATDAVDARQAAARVTEVLTNWDLDGADFASTALAHCCSLDEAFDAVWWFCLRDFTNIGHNPIFAAQAHRTLQHIGWRHGTDVVRSLVYGLLDGKPGAADATFVANHERAARLVLPGPAGLSKPASQDVVFDLVAELRHATPDAASAVVVEALSKGMPLDSLWDALRLFAAEQSWRDPGILSAHAMTSVNALRYIAGRARTAALRSMAVLQAVSWQVLYRDFLSSRGSYDKQAQGIHTLQRAEQDIDAAAVFAAAGDDARKAAPLALAAAQNSTNELMASARHWLLRKAHEHHDYKFTAALLEEMQAASADTAPRLFAASLGYLRKPSDRDHELWALVLGG